jgi:serine protease Do
MRTSYVVCAAVIALGAASQQPASAQQADRQERTRTRVIVQQGGGTSYLGIGVVEVDAGRAKELSLKEERGVEVKNVVADSPASKAGIKETDVVLEFAGQPVQGTEQFMRLVRETPAGREVKLVVWRSGSSQTLTVTVGSRKGMFPEGGEFGFNMPVIPPVPPRPPAVDMPRFQMNWQSPMLGIEGESLNAQLAEFFGVKEGVLVRSVVKNSAAEKAGIKAGDVIVKVDDSKVTTAREISSALRSAQSKKSVPVVVVRGKKETTVTVTVEQNTGGTKAMFTASAA